MPRPGDGTPRTALRLDLDGKAAAQARCREDGTTLTAVINAALADYAAGRWSPTSRPLLAPIYRLLDKWRDLNGTYLPLAELERALAAAADADDRIAS